MMGMHKGAASAHDGLTPFTQEPCAMKPNPGCVAQPLNAAQATASATTFGTTFTTTLPMLLTLLALVGMPRPAAAASGLAAPGADALWPQWQARVALQLSTPQNHGQASPGMQLGSRSLATKPWDSAQATRSLQGGALLGDYYFARPFFGNFRASGGVVVGGLAGLPAGVFTPNSPAATSVGVSLLGGAAGGASSGLTSNSNGNSSSGTGAGTDSPQAAPYLGLGFTGAAWHNRVSFSADLGLVSDRPRALFGNQGMDNALRDMRLSPVMQLGLRYSF
jgi:hypothetical protein